MIETTLVRLVAMLLVWQTAAVCPAQETTLLRDLRVRLHGPKGYTGQLRDVIAACETAINRLLPELPAPNDDWLTIVVMEEGTPAPLLPPLGRDVHLAAEASVQTVVDTCARVLIDRRLGASFVRRAGVGEWLSASVVYHLLYARTVGGMYQPDYSPLVASFRQAPPPSPVALLNHPVSPTWPYAFRFYAMHAHAVCDVLRETTVEGNPALARFLLRLGEGVDAEEAWRGILAHVVDDGQEAELWLRRRIEGLARRGLAGTPGETLGERVREVFGVATLAPGADGAMRYQRVPIQELKDRFPDARLDPATLVAKERQVFELLKQAPLMLQRPLANYMAALQARRSGRRWGTFIAMLEEADADLQRALERYEGASRLLDELERHYAGADADLAPYLAIAVDHARAVDALAPYTNPSIFAVAQK